jgi:hypothetical protein
MPTTSVRRRSSLLSRSFNRPSGAVSREVLVDGVVTEVAEVCFEVVYDLGVPLGFAGPAAFVGIGMQLSDVGKLSGESGYELGGGREVVTGFTDVGVRTSARCEVPRAVAGGKTGLEVFAVHPGNSFGDDRTSGGCDRDPGSQFPNSLFIGVAQGRRSKSGIAQCHLRGDVAHEGHERRKAHSGVDELGPEGR